ncbi:hypothetical protein A3F55_01475 [Candidatus Adlerbacteria bacterium RIFCSPHIGHO2_12_FULL_53_18]|uniref:Uncharacterized protein n=1 Tax=Candidatus Adlerbacteria bacterium RIFCSPHIGHO2_12_FULL_53_18 TaxID=1797242 RepID=A0A1F4XRM5_9BACT|nr:MAG: hypothetical protein A3F55_01475 [Candidatus Adlerbacteria bacterium RIFCSPHIGHO2_12_FULL_53_18]
MSIKKDVAEIAFRQPFGREPTSAMIRKRRQELLREKKPARIWRKAKKALQAQEQGDSELHA